MKYSRAHAIEMGKRLVAQDRARAMGMVNHPLMPPTGMGGTTGMVPQIGQPDIGQPQNFDMGGAAQQGPPQAEPPPGYATYGPSIGMQKALR